MEGRAASHAAAREVEAGSLAAIDAGRLQRLDGFLQTVPPVLAVRLARAVELDRLNGGALPHETILAALRPKLRQIERRLERLPDPRRLFCGIFEDLFLSGTRLRKQRGRIARSSVAPVWTWITETLIPGEAAAVIDAIRAKLLEGAIEFVRDDLRALHQKASAAILAVMPREQEAEGWPEVARTLGGADIAADAYDMARMMEMAATVAGLQRELPRPIKSLDDHQIGSIRAAWEAVVAERPDDAPYVAFLVLGRLEKPWEILRLAGALSRKMDDILISHTDAGLVGELLLQDLEDCVARLAPIRANDLDVPRTVDAVSYFGRLSTGMVRELGIKRDGAWGKRLMHARAGISENIERLLGRAVRDITQTLPLSRKGGFGFRARRTPDLARNLDAQRAKRALDIAQLVAGTRAHAAAGAFGSVIAEIDEKVGALLRHYTTDLIEELGSVPLMVLKQAEAFVAHAAALSEILLGEEEGAIVRRRSAAAIEARTQEELVA